MMICSINPEPASHQETLCALRFAAKVNACETRAAGGAQRHITCGALDKENKEQRPAVVQVGTTLFNGWCIAVCISQPPKSGMPNVGMLHDAPAGIMQAGCMARWHNDAILFHSHTVIRIASACRASRGRLWGSSSGKELPLGKLDSVSPKHGSCDRPAGICLRLTPSLVAGSLWQTSSQARLRRILLPESACIGTAAMRDADERPTGLPVQHRILGSRAVRPALHL